MKNQQVAKHIEGIDKEISRLTSELSTYDAQGGRYREVAHNIEELCNVRERLVKGSQADTFKGVSMDTIVSGAVSLASVLLILNFEKADIITSKAMSIATKWLGK